MKKLTKQIFTAGIAVLLFSFVALFNESGHINKAELFIDRHSINHEAESEINEENNPDYRGEKSATVTPQQLQKTWSEVLSRPSENDFDFMPVNSWTCIGPYGMRRPTNWRLFSGRVLDIEVEGVPSTRIAAASGGLWGFNFLSPIPLSDKVTCLAIGSFASKPLDPNTIIIGTGEPEPNGPGTGGPGNGIWRTVDGGNNWTQINLSPIPAAFYKLRYQPGNSSRIHAATSDGYFRSDNGGSNWTQYLDGKITDLAINPSNSNVIYVAKWNDGIFKSVNGGDSFTKLTNFPVISSRFGRVSISMCDNVPAYIYANVSGIDSGGRTMGIYRTTNDGANWQDVSFTPGDYHWNQGHYNNCIGVSPTNPNLVLLGAGSLLRTINGGISWTQIMPLDNDSNLHSDQHCIRWHSNGVDVWLGNDGGFAYSNNYGESWLLSTNQLPITQFYDFDIGIMGPYIVVAGGTQDNAFPVSINCTVNSPGVWNWEINRDASSSKVDKFNPLRIMGLSFNSQNWLDKTTDGGSNWTSALGGLTSSTPIRNIEDDGTFPIYCYIPYGDKIYHSNNFGDSWSQFSTTTFPSQVWKINVSKFGAGGNIVYAVITGGIRVYDSGTWYNRSAGLPANIQCIAQHPHNNNIAYAITWMTDYTQKIFKTTNRGVNWINITGNLPNVAMTDLVVHPANDNILFASSKFGMWKTTNGGTNWFRWTNGMPIANQIVRLKVIDSTSTSGRFYVVAASHGRGIWIREGSGDDPIGIHNQNTNIPLKYELYQNYPNPFNPSTKIAFSLPHNSFVELKVFDIAGREVQTVVNEQMTSGNHEVEFNGTNLASGVYFYVINAGEFNAVKKMIFVK